MKIINHRYELRELISSGGFGSTYIAYDQMLQINVAIKEYYETDETKKEKLIREARSLARFSSEAGIVNVRDYIEEDGKVYLVMELLDGQDLKDYLSEHGKMSFMEAYDLLKEMMTTVSKMHEVGLIHRDISPENIRVLADGRLKLMDFGTALEYESLNQTDSENKTVTVMVKPGYAPWEQYINVSAQGPWTDVYAFCATMYRCITGKTPSDSLQRSFHDDLKKPSDLGCEIKPELESILMKGLAVRPEDRISSLPELSSLVESNIKDTEKRSEKTEDKKGDKKEKKRQEKKEKKSVGIGKAKLSLAILILILLAGAGFLGAKLLLSNPYNKGNYSSVSSKTVTANIIKQINGDRKTRRVYFYDCKISDDVMEEIGKMKRIESISLHSCEGFTSVKALAKIETLTSVDIEYSDNQQDQVKAIDIFKDGSFPNITDLSIRNMLFLGKTESLAGFTNLQKLTLDIRENNISFVRSMPDLKYVSFTQMDLSGDSILPMENHSSLTDFYADDCMIDDLSWAAGCKNLQVLNLGSTLANHYGDDTYSNNVKDITALAECENLREVIMEYNAVVNVLPLAKLNALYKVNFKACNLISLKGLEEKENLTYLNVSSNKIRDISPLSSSLKLQEVFLADNQISDLTPLGQCSEIKVLDIDKNEISDLSACENMYKMESIQAGENNIYEVDVLANASSLQAINLRGNHIDDISFLRNGFSELQLLILDDNKITDLSALRDCSKISVFSAEKNELHDLDGLQGKAELKALRADHNEITDISALADSVSLLYYLDLGENQISDISVLENVVPSASSFSDQCIYLLENNNISDASHLPKVTYDSLVIYGNPLKDYSFMDDNDTFRNTKLTLPYVENVDLSSLGKCKKYYMDEDVTFVDVPANQKSNLLKKLKEAMSEYVDPQPTFLTKEEADAKVEEQRQQLTDIVFTK